MCADDLKVNRDFFLCGFAAYLNLVIFTDQYLASYTKRENIIIDLNRVNVSRTQQPHVKFSAQIYRSNGYKAGWKLDSSIFSEMPFTTVGKMACQLNHDDDENVSARCVVNDILLMLLCSGIYDYKRRSVSNAVLCQVFIS